MKTMTKPQTVEINERTGVAFARAAVLIAEGYQFSSHSSPEVHGFIGQASITLVLANPEPDAIKGAAESLALALERETAKTERDAAAALAASEAEQTRQAAKAALEAELNAAKNLVRRLDAAVKKA
jgi:uncharacterized protein YbaP (TraB family)